MISKPILKRPPLCRLCNINVRSLLSALEKIQQYFNFSPSASDAWMPVDFIGPFIIFGHYDAGLECTDFWGVPPELRFKVRLAKEDYQKLRDGLGLQASGSKSKRVPVFAGENESEFRQHILENEIWKLNPEWQSLTQEQARGEIMRSPEVEMGIQASLKQHPVLPIHGLAIEGISNEATDGFECLPLYMDGDGILYVAMTDMERAGELEDTLNAHSKAYQFIEPVFVTPSVLALLREGQNIPYVSEFTGNEKDIDTADAYKCLHCDRYDFKNINEDVLEDPEMALAYLFKNALRLNASDIHIQEVEGKTCARFRINNFLHELHTFPKPFLPRINSVIAQLGGVDAHKKLIPHSGRFSITCNGMVRDVRVSLIPHDDEQSCVLRIHGRTDAFLKLDALGMSPRDEEVFRYALKRKSGIILVTGPTGSGKSTTLYAALNELNEDTTLSIETIEDPVEKKIERIKQFQVRPHLDSAKNLSFARLFREVLRHDPDIVMVGEIRDKETAELAVQASQTGHLVLSTLHTNDSIGAIQRFASLGIEREQFADAAILIQAQRLVGILCDNCKAKVDPSALGSLLDACHRHGIDNLQGNFFRARGCDACRHTGFASKRAIFELLPITEELRSAIAEGMGRSAIASIAQKGYFKTLFEDAMRYVISGEVSIDEATCYTNVFDSLGR